MLKRLLAWLLRFTGKNYTPDAELPDGLIASTLTRRATCLLRGLIRLRARVFVGRGVELRGKARLRVGRYATLDRGCQIDGYARDGVEIGARTKLGAFTVVSCTSHMSKLGRGMSIGHDCGIGEFGYFGASGGIRVGNDVIMGQYVSFHAETHRYEDPARPIRLQGVQSAGIEIEDDVWVGSKATFLDGCHVGRHSVVAAGAVVRGRFPAFSVIGGVPARLLKRLPGAPDEGPAGDEAGPARGAGQTDPSG